ncbi:MAG TPA: hypothetical protein VGK67_28790, partial [Myxococcales bacterium]
MLAQVEITFSNSMIEAWWRSLKHQGLFLNQLDSLAAVQRLVTFYVGQHNAVMPHSAFKGQTPNEIFFGTGAGLQTSCGARGGRPQPLVTIEVAARGNFRTRLGNGSSARLLFEHGQAR